MCIEAKFQELGDIPTLPKAFSDEFHSESGAIDSSEAIENEVQRQHEQLDELVDDWIARADCLIEDEFPALEVKLTPINVDLKYTVKVHCQGQKEFINNGEELFHFLDAIKPQIN